jgi:ABC-2 type transport system permease protein
MNTALLHAEFQRAIRNRQTLFFSAALPALLFLMFSSGTGSGAELIGGLETGPYAMAGLATYGAMHALFTGGGIIAAERAVGWSRLLRVAGLRGRDYLATKLIVSYATATIGLVVVLVTGATMRQVDLRPTYWLGIALTILVSLLPVAILGIIIGLVARPQALQAMFSAGSVLLALSGALWNSIEHTPDTLAAVIRLLPVYWAGEAGRAVLRGTWLGWRGTITLAAWTIALAAVAAWCYRSDRLRPTAAGTT